MHARKNVEYLYHTISAFSRAETCGRRPAPSFDNKIYALQRATTLTLLITLLLDSTVQRISEERTDAFLV